MTEEKQARKPPMVKFKFTNPEDWEKVFMELGRASKVIMLKEDDSPVFIVPRKSLEILDQAEVGYKVLEEMQAYSALLALRSATTSLEVI
jgi:hypothetical protein